MTIFFKNVKKRWKPWCVLIVNSTARREATACSCLHLYIETLGRGQGRGLGQLYTSIRPVHNGLYIRAVSTASEYRHLAVFLENMGTIGQYAHSFSSLQFPGRTCPHVPRDLGRLRRGLCRWQPALSEPRSVGGKTGTHHGLRQHWSATSVTQ